MRPASITVLLPVLLAAALVSCKPAPAPAPQAKVMTETDKTLYTIGALISRKLEVFSLTPQELELVQRGLADGVSKKTLEADVDKYGPKVEELHQSRMAAAGQREAKAGEAFLVKAAAEPGATKTASGLIIRELKAGTGPSPKPTDQVKVNYEGKLIDGKVFDSSASHGEPATFPLNRVIPCWTEGVQLMKVGGKSQLVCPAAIAYGDRGSPPMINPGATLVFEVELLEVSKAP